MGTPGSGMDFDLNATNFSCTADELSTTNVTNRTAWMLFSDIQPGSIPIALIQIIFFLVGFTWNLFIVITYIVKHRLLKEPANLFIFYLAFIDLLTCALLLPINFIAVAANDYIFGSNDVTRCHVCFANGFLVSFLILISLHVLACLSFDRFLLLSFPLWFKKISTWKAVAILIAVTVLCLIISILPAFGFGEWEFNLSFGTCLPRWTGRRNRIPNIAYMALVIVEAAIPVTILIVTNIWTFRVVKRFLKTRHHRRSIYKNKKEENKKLKKEQIQLVKVFGALLVANIISWTPVFLVFFIVFILSRFGKEDVVPPYIFTIGWLCFLSSSVAHPIIESFFIKELRYQVRRAQTSVRSASRSLIRVATSTFTDIPSPDDDGTSKILHKPRHLPVGRTGTNISLNVSTHMTELNNSREGSPQSLTPVIGNRDRSPSPLAAKTSNGVVKNDTAVQNGNQLGRTACTNPQLASLQNDTKGTGIITYDQSPSLVLKSPKGLTPTSPNKKQLHVCISIPAENSSDSNDIHDNVHNNHKLMTYISNSQFSSTESTPV